MKFVPAAIVCSIVASLCASCSPAAEEEAAQQFTFSLSDKPQHVTFLTQSWEGGGDPVLLVPDERQTLRYQRIPILVDHIAQEIISASSRGPKGHWSKRGCIWNGPQRMSLPTHLRHETSIVS